MSIFAKKKLMNFYFLGIESSCDDTSAAVLNNSKLCSNIVSSQKIHTRYGGVVPELASREHQKNIIPVVNESLLQAGIKLKDISAIVYTKGPGLLGSLMVGVSFAKGLSASTGIPLIGVNHLHGHILSHTITENDEDEYKQKFPFLCLLISGGHTLFILVEDYLKYKVLGQTIDDAAGEAFDKCAKVLGLQYPGGPIIDKMSETGDENKFEFGIPKVSNFDFSFSGLKTSFLYKIRDGLKINPNFITENLYDLSASLQKAIIDIISDKLIKISRKTGIKDIVITGGVSANKGLRKRMNDLSEEKKINICFPKIKFAGDNAAMIAIVGMHKYKLGMFDKLDSLPQAKIDFYEI